MPQQTAVFMYSTAGPDGQTVTLQLRETDETIELPASMLSKMSRQTDTATLSISYQDSTEVLTDGTIDLLLATTPLHSSGKSNTLLYHIPGSILHVATIRLTNYFDNQVYRLLRQ